MKGTKGLKWAVFVAVLALYVSFFWINFSHAEPAGATVSNLSTDSGPNISASSRQDSGGTITTVSFNVTQQNEGWKAYVGNISGRLVLRNSNDQSIYEWSLNDSSMGGTIFVSRSDSVNWSTLVCAGDSEVASEDSALGFSISASDSLNKTFNFTIHKALTISGLGPISENACNFTTVTYVNNSEQLFLANMTNTTNFQEILLHDGVSMVFGTFIDQDSFTYETNVTNNITYDFQILIAENKSSSTPFTYYFYADIT